MTGFDRAKVGKRLSAHPLHETFLGEGNQRKHDEFYAKADPAMLVADLDTPLEDVGLGRTAAPSLERVQRVYTSPLADLAMVWSEAAKRVRAKVNDPRPKKIPPEQERPRDEPR